MKNKAAHGQSHSHVVLAGEDRPIFVAHTIGETQVREFFHDLHGGSIHQVQRAAVVGFDKSIAIGKPMSSVNAGLFWGIK